MKEEAKEQILIDKDYLRELVVVAQNLRDAVERLSEERIKCLFTRNCHRSVYLDKN